MPIRIQDNYVQTAVVRLTADTTTTSTAFVTLLTLSGQTYGGSLNIFASVSSSNTANTAQNFFRITVDGVSVGASSSKGDGGLLSATTVAGNNITANSGILSVGTHTILLQWRVSGGIGQIRPVAAVDQEYASFMVEEVYV